MRSAEVCHNAVVLLQVLDAVLRIAAVKHFAAKMCWGFFFLLNECGIAARKEKKKIQLRHCGKAGLFCHFCKTYYNMHDFVHVLRQLQCDISSMYCLHKLTLNVKRQFTQKNTFL